MYNGNKFKNAMGAHILKGLFFEEAVNSDRPDTLYTLKEFDHDVPGEKVYLSIHKAYVDMEDTSEYEFAKRYFDGWTHWKRLCACNWFKPFLASMREELDVKLRARALNAMREVASDPSNKSHYQANKNIFDNGLAIAKDNRGRPSKEKIKEEADKLFHLSSEIEEDYDRILGKTN